MKPRNWAGSLAILMLIGALATRAQAMNLERPFKNFMNWKKFWFAVIGIGLPLAMLGATIRWYNDAGIPQKVNLVGTEIFSLQQTSPNAYRWALASDVRRYMGGIAGDPIINIYVTTVYATTNYVTNQYVTLQYVTNQYVTTNFNQYSYTTNLYTTLQYVTNQYVTTNFNQYSYTTNLYTTLQYVTNLYVTTNFVNNEYVTNQYVTYSFTTNLYATYLTNLYSYITNLYTSNAYITNLTVENSTNTWVQVKNLNVTSNIYYMNARATNVPWAGPTNTLDFGKGSVQSYTVSGAISVTNVTGEETPYQNGTILCLTNSSANTLTNTVTATGWQIGNGDSLSFTNGQVLQLWFQNIGGMKTLATKKYSPQ